MGASSDPSHLSRALSELMAVKGLSRVRGGRELAAAWSDVAGPKIARQTRVVGINRGVLNVEVTNAALRSELTSFYKASLLEALQTRYGDLRIRDLKFRLKGRLLGP